MNISTPLDLLHRLTFGSIVPPSSADFKAFGRGACWRCRMTSPESHPLCHFHRARMDSDRPLSVHASFALH